MEIYHYYIVNQILDTVSILAYLFIINITNAVTESRDEKKSIQTVEMCYRCNTFYRYPYTFPALHTWIFILNLKKSYEYKALHAPT